MKQHLLHTATWQIERRHTLSLGYCFMSINDVQGKPSNSPGLNDTNWGWKISK